MPRRDDLGPARGVANAIQWSLIAWFLIVLGFGILSWLTAHHHRG